MEQELRECMNAMIAFPQAELSDILSHFHARHMAKGEVWLRAGTVCEHLAFIGEGVMRMYHEIDGSEVTQWLTAEHTFITAVSSFVFRTPSRWCIQAVTDCRILVISRDHFERMKKYPKWLEFDSMALANAFALLEERMFSQLSMSAEERYAQLLGHTPSLLNRVPLQYIASMLGITPETLSRLRKKHAQSIS